MLGGNRAFAPGPGNDALRAIDDQGACRVGRGRGVAQIPANSAATLDLGRADQLDGVDESRKEALHVGMLANHRGRGCRAEAQAVAVHGNLNQLRDALDVDERSGPMQARAELDQQIGATREQFGGAEAVFEQADRGLCGGRAEELEVFHE